MSVESSSKEKKGFDLKHDIGKRILLIRPKDNMPAFWFPLALALLKSNLSDKHTVEIMDCALHDISASSRKFKDKILSFNPDIVGVSILTLVVEEAMQILNKVKNINRNIITVAGGPHPTLYPDEIIKKDYVDFILRGEADLSFCELVDNLNNGDTPSAQGLVYLKDGEVVDNGLCVIEDLDQIKYPDYFAARLDEYWKAGYRYGGYYGKVAPIWATRGCPYICKFCSSPLINGRNIRAHSIKYMMGLIKHLYLEYEIRQFTIVDDNFTFRIDYAKEFCREIIKMRSNGQFNHGIVFTTPNGIRLQKIDDELLTLMKKAGWDGVTIAPESGSLKVLKLMRKGIKPEMVPEAVNRIKAAGLRVRAFFIVGYPGETRDDLDDTVKLIRKCKLDALNVHLFHPIPGTPVYDDLVNDGHLMNGYIPDSFCNAILPKILQVEDKNSYVTPEFENFSLFWFWFRENVFLFFRNPYSLIYFIKINGAMNVVKKLYQIAVNKK